jgi:hypothetical protein
MIVSAVLALVGCGEPEWVDLRGGATECMTAVFRRDATIEEINAVLEDAIYLPRDPKRTGQYFRPGIGSLISRDVHGHQAYEVCFRPNRTTDIVSPKAWLRHRLEESPHVQGVFETLEPELIVIEE